MSFISTKLSLLFKYLVSYRFIIYNYCKQNLCLYEDCPKSIRPLPTFLYLCAIVENEYFPFRVNLCECSWQVARLYSSWFYNDTQLCIYNHERRFSNFSTMSRATNLYKILLKTWPCSEMISIIHDSTLQSTLLYDFWSFQNLKNLLKEEI